MGCIEKRIHEWNYWSHIDCDCHSCLFTGCSGTGLKGLWIQARLGAPGWQVGFQSAQREVYFQTIHMYESSPLSSVVRNYWCNGEEGAAKEEGYYSLLVGAKQLQVRNNPGFLNDLAGYVEGRYCPGDRWEPLELGRGIKVEILCTDQEMPAVEVIRRYFTSVSVNVRTALGESNVVAHTCDCHTFLGCAGARPRELMLNARLTGEGSLVSFFNAESAVRIPSITVGERGELRGAVQNYWTGEGANGFYSLLAHAEQLTIRENQQAVRNLADYMAGRYELDRYIWKTGQLGRSLRVILERVGPATNLAIVLARHFSQVEVNGRPVVEYTASYAQALKESVSGYKGVSPGPMYGAAIATEQVLFDGDALVCHVLQYTRPLQKLVINQQVNKNGFICFHDTAQPVVIEQAVIKEGGDLRALLQNACFDGCSSRLFSLLHTANSLVVEQNPKALRDLADYVEGAYDLNESWPLEGPNKGMSVVVSCSDGDLWVVKRLRCYFRRVSLARLTVTARSDLLLDHDCDVLEVVSPNGLAPQRIVFNAMVRGYTAISGIVHGMRIPVLVVGPRGDIRGTLQNKLSGYDNPGLLALADTIVLDSNPDAVINLSNCVAWRLELGEEFVVPELAKSTVVKINGVNGCEAEVCTLRDYFGCAVVDGRKVLCEVQEQMLADVNNMHALTDKLKAYITCKQQVLSDLRENVEKSRESAGLMRRRLQRRRRRFAEYLELAQ